MIMDDLYLKDSFINDNIPYLFNANIIEYDMKDAGFSLTREYKLLSDSMIEKLDKMDKDERKIKLGKIQIKDREYSRKLADSFKLARGLFFEANMLETSDVISIKKDAIFTTKQCEETKFGKYIVFRPKNTYTSYIHLQKNIEIYYSPSKTDVKGLGIDKDIMQERQELHDGYMLKFINTFCNKMETSTSKEVLQYIRRYTDKYKKGELEIGCYRTFDNRSAFILDDNGDVDKAFNLTNVITKLARIPI